MFTPAAVRLPSHPPTRLHLRLQGLVAHAARRILSGTLAGIALLHLLPGAGAQLVHVPGDFTSLQDAIDAMPEGATIVVHGGTHDAIRIPRAVTLVGDPEATIRTACCVPFDDIERPAIRLEGPGGGTVALERIRTEGSVQDGIESEGGAGIAGGGFDELVAGSDGIDPFGGSQLPGGPGIDVSVPFLMISESSVRGGASNYPDFPSSQLKGTFGVRAPGASVALLDSSVAGGDVDDTLFSPVAPCPTGCEAILGGTGGTGLLAGTLFIADSTVSGGRGSDLSCFSLSGPMLVCTKPDGPGMIVDSLQRLRGELSLSGPLLLGGTCQLTWSARGGPALLLVGLGVQEPELVPDKGLLFLDVFLAHIVVVATGTGVSDTFSIPADAALTGTVLTVQLWDPANGLTRPVVSALVP
jgi:hypothetical protein